MKGGSKRVNVREIVIQQKKRNAEKKLEVSSSFGEGGGGRGACGDVSS